MSHADEPRADLTTSGAELFSPQRLRLARERKAWTQKELAAEAGISAAAVSQLEKGQFSPTTATVESLADALDFPAHFFALTDAPSSRPDLDLDALDGMGHFRSIRSVTATQRRQALSWTHLVRDVAHELGRHVRLPTNNVTRVEVHPDEDPRVAEGCAAAARTAWGIGRGPIDDVVAVLERNGVVLARCHLDTRLVAAYSAPFPDNPVIVLRADSANRERDRFSAAHEAGHLLMHVPGSTLAPRSVEEQAHRFASALLMPADDIAEELPSSANWPLLMVLKKRWGVSIAALLRRALTLDIMDERTFAQAMRTMSARGWRVLEPGDAGVPETPQLLVQAYELSGVDTNYLSSRTGWPAQFIAEVLATSSDWRPALSL